jgi:hypothetical protein
MCKNVPLSLPYTGRDAGQEKGPVERINNEGHLSVPFVYNI